MKLFVSDLHIHFKIGLDKLDTSAYPELSPEVIDIILNIAYEVTIKNKFTGNNVLRKGFEGNSKRISDLKNLVSSVTLPAVQNTENLEYYTFEIENNAPRYWLPLKYVIGSKVKICGKQYGSNINNSTNTTQLYKADWSEVQIDDIEKSLEDPFQKPKSDSVILTYETDGNIRVYTGGLSTIKELELTYLKEPLKLSIDAIGINDPVGFTNIPEVNSIMHQEIVDRAVSWTLENIESLRRNSNLEELRKIE